jgi:CheY-like chemotaxis protein
VEDNGTGIDAELLPRVFELFVQGERGLDRSQGGLGIGLTLVKRLVELPQGRVEAHSDGVGAGARFRILLPSISAVAQPEPVGGASQPHAAQEVYGRRILVVDDNVDAAESLGLMLGTMGHHVQVVHDGRAALEAARETVPEIVLLDISMPGFDGHEVVRRLRQEPAFRRVRFAAITGLARPEDVRRSREAGFDEHLVKPVAPERLREVIERL